MRTGTLSENWSAPEGQTFRTGSGSARSLAKRAKLGLAASLLAAAGCASDHRVSPWGTRGGPTLEAFLRPPDLDAELARVDAETATLGLVRTQEIRAELPPKGSGRAAVLRGYEGLDVAGRTVHAVRVATPRGVVLALGPLDPGELDRDRATELVPALTMGDGQAGLAFRSGTDLNGDGAADVVLRNEKGTLEIWRIGELGSGAYAIRMVVPPTRGTDADGDGRVDLWGQLPTAAGDPIAPIYSDVGTFTGGGYSDGTPAARAWHARAASVPLPAAPATKEGAPTPATAQPTSVSDAARLKAALEHAWHAILAGQPRENVLRELAREPSKPPLRTWFETHQRMLASVKALPP